MSDEYYQQEEAMPRPRRLATIDCAALGEAKFRRMEWLADGLLCPGLTVLAGSPKIGKSWMVMQLCMSVAKGEPFLGVPTHEGTALYIALEDSAARLQDRVLRLSDNLPDNLHFAVRCSEMGEKLIEELRTFVGEHPDTKLIVIDTYQRIRTLNSQTSYANDYLETSALKFLSDSLGVCIVLVHHTRKLADSDCFNEISGTNGIAGSADTLMVLKKEKRTDRKATLSATGRDIEDRIMELKLDRESCIWQVISDSAGTLQPTVLPEELLILIDYIRQAGPYDGTNGMFCEKLIEFSRVKVGSSQLKNKMNRFRYELEDRGIFFRSYRTSSMRFLNVWYDAQKDTTAQSDGA